jgi:hypothetical protein
LIKDYDLEIQYHPDKANLVADALSWKGLANMTMVFQFPDKLVTKFERLHLEVVAHAEAVTLEVQSTLEQEIRKGQLDDVGIQKINESMKQGEAPDFTEDEQGTVWFKGRLCVPETGELRETILREAHDYA